MFYRTFCFFVRSFVRYQVQGRLLRREDALDEGFLWDFGTFGRDSGKAQAVFCFVSLLAGTKKESNIQQSVYY